MKKPFSAIALLLALALLLTGCAQPKPGVDCGSTPLRECLEQKAVSSGAPEYCKMMESFADTENCIRKLAISKLDSTICNLYSSSKDDCLFEVALNAKSVNFCSEIGGPIKANKCYYDLAIQTGAPETCLLAQLSKQECIELLAEREENISFCNLLSLPLERAECLEMASQKLGIKGFCDSFPETENRDVCHLGMAIKYASSNECMKLSTKAGVDDCLIKVGAYSAEHVALKNYLASLCGQARMPEIREQCPETMQGYDLDLNSCDIFLQDKGAELLKICLDRLLTQVKDEEACFKYKETLYQFNCLERFASDSNSIEPCKLMYVDTNRLGCFVSIANATGDKSICKKVPTLQYRQLRNDCFLGVALNHFDPFACDQLVPDINRSICRAQIAVADANLLVCGEIMNKPLNEPNPFMLPDKCFDLYARDMNDLVACDHIKNGATRQACIADVNALLQ